MGKAWYPKDSDDFDTLFLYADSAMYEAKKTRKKETSEMLSPVNYKGTSSEVPESLLLLI